MTRSDFHRRATIDYRLSTLDFRLSDYRLSTMKLTGRAEQSREKWQKIARKITENHPDFCPGCYAGAVAAVGLPSPAFLYSRRLALCGRLCAPLWGVLAAGSIGIAPPPGAALWGVYGRFRRYYFPGAVDCLPLCAAVGGSVACFGACLYPCTLARLRGSVAAVGGGVWYSLHPGAAVSTCAPLSRGCGSCALSIVPAWPVEGQRKARASCTSSTRAQKNRRRDCTRGGSVVSFIHF